MFGRNPWGIKVLLHLISVACIPLSYQIGWQLSRNRWVAFFSGLIPTLSPDLLYYSNYIMADLPNLFFVLLFCYFLILGLETSKWHWILAAMITASAGNFTASKGSDALVDDALKARFQNSFPQEAIDNIKWYPPVPAGLETIEGAVLDRVNAAK